MVVDLVVAMLFILIVATAVLIVYCLSVQHSSPFTAVNSGYLSPTSDFHPLPWLHLYVVLVAFVLAALLPLRTVLFHSILYLALAFFLLIVRLRPADHRFHLELEMVESMRRYDPGRRETTHKWDVTQSSLECCGYDSFRDWPDDVPDSCCLIVAPGCGRNAAAAALNHRGCFPVIEIQSGRIGRLMDVVTVVSVTNLMIVSSPITSPWLLALIPDDWMRRYQSARCARRWNNDQLHSKEIFSK